MIPNRRQFIKTASAGLAITAISGSIMGCMPSGTGNGEKLDAFGIQLYTLRDVLPANPKEILKQVAAMGYNQIESYEGDNGMFWGMGNQGFKSYMDDLGMKIIASHCGIDDQFERKAAEAAAIGMRYLIVPSVNPLKNLDHVKRIADQFNKAGEICKKAGLRFAYHNHDYSFKLLEGEYPQDVMMNNTDPELVDYEMDIFWVETAGEDSLKWFEKYPNRFKLCHIKDRSKNTNASAEPQSCVLGEGEIDLKKILKAAKKSGMQYYFAEQEHYGGSSPLQASKQNADYLKAILI